MHRKVVVTINLRQVKAREEKNKKLWLKVNPKLNNNSGIYFLTRIDENGFKYAYVGQAKHILQRLATHLSGYTQHIDLSLKKHGVISEQNPTGWDVNFVNCKESDLDDEEKKYIKHFANIGYQLRNVSTGGQGDGRSSGQIGERKPSKGYRDGIAQGRKNMARELSLIAEKHLTIELRDDKKCNKVSQRQFEKFKELLMEGESVEKIKK